MYYVLKAREAVIKADRLDVQAVAKLKILLMCKRKGLKSDGLFLAILVRREDPEDARHSEKTGGTNRRVVSPISASILFSDGSGKTDYAITNDKSYHSYKTAGFTDDVTESFTDILQTMQDFEKRTKIT